MTSYILGMYEQKDLPHLCKFEKRPKTKASSGMSTAQMVRWTMFLLNLGVLVNAIVYFPLSSLLIFFTNWGLLLTLISIYFSIKCANDKDFLKKPNLVAWHHLLFEIAFLFDIIITIVYWSMIHANIMKSNPPFFPIVV
jgi:hypothetical protein